jgi:membrane-associated protease RseP (regulator of RpoE activity)
VSADPSYAWPESLPPRVGLPRPRFRVLVLHALLLLGTAYTTTVAGVQWEGIQPGADPHVLARGLPFSLTLIAILLTHESGHYVMCRLHGVDATLPYFLPAPPFIFPLGTFGAFIRIRSMFPDRRALFDIGAGGPWAGFVVALVALVVGLPMSKVVAMPDGAPVLELGDSLLTWGLTSLLVDADPRTVVLHPIAFAGWFGMFVTSINLIPAGQLDGGHVLYAAFGRRNRLIPLVLLGTLVWLGATGWNGWLLWAAIIALMGGLGHPPTRADYLPLDRRRLLGACASLALFAITFVPEPFRILA